MPYDDITKMRAELLERYGPNERPEEFDDGASMLGQNPYMQEVGIFGKPPKFNPARRTMGLDFSSVKNPVPTAIEDPTTAIVPAQPQQPKQINPLETLANMPMTRRKALEIPMNAAISNVGRGLIGEAVAPVVESAVAQVAPKVAQSTFVRNPIFDEYFQEYAVAAFNNAAENMPNEAGIAGYHKLREYLEGLIPEKTLKKYDKISDEADYEDDDGYLDSAIEAQNELEDFIYDHLKYLKPDELQDFSNHMIQYDTTPEEFADDVIRNLSNSGVEDVQIRPDDLINYLERARSQK
jgi:hypothetical protein